MLALVMWRTIRRLPLLRPSSSRLLFAAISPSHRRPPLPLPPLPSQSLSPPFPFPSLHSPFHGNGTSSSSSSDEVEDETSLPSISSEEISREAEIVISSLEDFTADAAEARRRLEKCGVAASPELVHLVLSRLRNHWSAAFTFFLWAENQPSYSHSIRHYHSMIGILGKFRRFDTAWSLIEQMRKSSILTPKTLIIQIRRYAAAREVAKSISTFYAMRRFGFSPGIEEFHGLLSALCRYKNVADAEHLLLCNAAVFPLETKSFNIVLNGWCSAVVSLREGRRFWGEIARRGIQPDAISYSSLISCCSKGGKVNEVLRVFEEMKNLGIDPDRKAYNSVVYALAINGCFEKARRLMEAMEGKGISPNVATFNSLIRGFCKARRPQDARQVFDEMQERGLAPSLPTFHAIFRTARTSEEVFETLERMKKMNCSPKGETYVMLIRKLCRWRCHESVAKLWEELSSSNGGGPDRSAYVVLIHGLFLSGNLVKALKYYEEMKTRGFPPEPRTEEMMQAWISGRDSGELHGAAAVTEPAQRVENPRRRTRERDSIQRPEDRRVTRERGFSLLD